MRTMHTVLRIGSYDWDPALMPVKEFEGRVENVQAIMRDKGWDGVLVYGDVRNFGLLVHVGNIVPKMGWIIILIPQAGAPRLISRGTTRMMAATAAQTWIEDARASGNPEAALTEWLDEQPAATGGGMTVGIYGDDFMPSNFYDMVAKGCAAVKLENADDALAELANAPSAKKLELTRQSCAILTNACGAIAKAHANGATVVEAILEGEHQGRADAAQDVRTLFSLDQGKTLRPFDRLSDVTSDPLVAYVGVLFHGYFAEGLVTISANPGPARAAAADGLQALIDAAKAGVKSKDLVATVESAIAPFAAHPITAGSVGYSVGLTREQDPHLTASANVELTDGGIYSLRVGTTDPKSGHALLSAMVQIDGDGNEVLWSGI